MEIELIFLPDVENIMDSGETFQGKTQLSLAMIGLAIFGDIPHTLHIMEIAKRATDSLISCEFAHCLYRCIIFIISQLILGTLCVDVTIFFVKPACMVHLLGRFLKVSVMLQHSCFCHGKIDRFWRQLNSFFYVEHGFLEIAAEMEVVVLCQEVVD